jgi:hypothetical protein
MMVQHFWEIQKDTFSCMRLVAKWWRVKNFEQMLTAARDYCLSVLHWNKL